MIMGMGMGMGMGSTAVGASHQSQSASASASALASASAASKRTSKGAPCTATEQAPQKGEHGGVQKATWRMRVSFVVGRGALCVWEKSA